MMNIKRIGLLSLALVLALGGLGVGYAQWTEPLTIGGTVRTGELDWEFTDAWTSDEGESRDRVSGEGFMNIILTAWHIGSTTAVLSDTDNDGDSNLCTVTLSNVYPRYHALVSATARNNGDVPLRILAPVLTSDTLTDLAETAPGSLHWVSDQLEIQYLNNVGMTIPVGGEVGLDLRVRVRSGAAQGATYDFTLTITGEQSP